MLLRGREAFGGRGASDHRGRGASPWAFWLGGIIRLCKTAFYTGFNTASYAKTYAKASFTQAAGHKVLKDELS